MSREAAGPGAGDRTQTVLQMAPPGAHHQPGHVRPDHENSVQWMKRFLNGEYDRWMLAKRLLNVEEDHVIVKVLLDFFQSHGGFDGSMETAPSSPASTQPVTRGTPPVTRGTPPVTPRGTPPVTRGTPPVTRETPPVTRGTPPVTRGTLPTDRPSEQPQPTSPDAAAGCDSSPSRADDPDDPASPVEESPRLTTNGRTRLQNGRRGTLKKARAPPAVEPEPEPERPPPELPSVDPQLMPLFSCGLCGAGDFPNLAAHFEHLWAAHTELRMLGSAQRRRVPLKLRPHMFVLCALCGLNNRSTSTAGAADCHLTRAHLPARHRRVLQETASGPLRFGCDVCGEKCESRAELAIHALDAGHGCPGFVCAECGAEGEGAANERHHRLWHRAVMPFQCYLCAERFATEPECVTHVRAEHAASFNVHRCASCPYTTSIVGQFIVHARSHVGLNACVCHKCGVIFQTAQSLRRHLMTHALSEFRCQHCDKSFRHPLPLERHVRSQHLSPEDHKCGACGKLFSSRYHLERHALIHSGRRPHQCDRCGRGFVQKGDLARHVRKCRAGEVGEPLPMSAFQPPAAPPPPPPPPPIAPPPPPHTVLPPMPPPPLPTQPQQHSVLLQPPPATLAMPLPAQGAG